MNTDQTQTTPSVDEQQADLVPSATIEQVMDSLYNWATQSIVFVTRRNFLTKHEKLQALSFLDDYQHFLIGQRDHPGLRRDRPRRDLWEHLEIEARLNHQARMNAQARFYEIPEYPLPETVQPAQNPFATFNVTSDLMYPALFDGDRLDVRLIDVADYPNTTGLVVVGVRLNWRTPRRWRIARLVSINEQEIRLSYDNPKRKEEAEAVVSLSEGVLLYKVFRISRDIK